MILLTGASGFIGKNLVPELAAQHTLRIIVRTTSKISLFKGMKNVEIVYGDIEKDKGIEAALQEISVVVHCAGRTRGTNFSEYYRSNSLGTYYLVKAMQRTGVRKILYLSSHAACGPCTGTVPTKENEIPRPVSFYGRSKRIAEDTIKESSLDYVILRPVAVYGQFDIDILQYIKLINTGLCPIIGNGRAKINLLHVKDLVNLIVDIIRKDMFTNTTYFVNDGMCYTYQDVLGELQGILKVHAFTCYIPKSLALLFGLLNDVLLPQHRRLIWRDKVREMANNDWLCCSDRVVHDHSFTPQFTLSQGMLETINWYKTHGYLH
jgi:nucleoside-diphosphate-sugar epimerase